MDTDAFARRLRKLADDIEAEAVCDEPKFKPGDCAEGTQLSVFYLITGLRSSACRGRSAIWNTVEVMEDGRVREGCVVEHFLRPIPRETK